MSKIAIFVEGMTESLFVQRLCSHIAGSAGVTFVLQEWVSNKIVMLSSVSVGTSSHTVLIIDCHGDGAVASALLDQRESLKRAGYTSILGLRDLYPASFGQSSAIESALAKLVPANMPPTRIVIAIHEVEAWFIRDYTHFSKIDARLTEAVVSFAIGEHIRQVNAERLRHPAEALDNIYKTVDKRYKKRRNSVSRTVNALDMAKMVSEYPSNMTSLTQFIGLLALSLGSI